MLFFFHGALQRVLMPAGEIHHLSHFGFSDFKGKHANNSEPLFVNSKHDLETLGVVKPKKPLEDMNDEFHRCKIVVQKHDLIHRRSLRARFGFGQQAGVILWPAGGVGHDRVGHGGKKGHAENLRSVDSVWIWLCRV